MFGISYLGGGPGVSLTLYCFVVHSTRAFVLSLALCYFVLVFFSPFSIAITSLWEERACLRNLVLVWFCLFPLGVWEELRRVIVALPGLFSYLFLAINKRHSSFPLVQQLSHYFCL